jgi:3-oxoacyl-[acyl-carrier-protein] synthase II
MPTPSTDKTCSRCGKTSSTDGGFCPYCGASLVTGGVGGRHRVVVTGVGAVTSIGLNAGEAWLNLLQGANGIKTIPYLIEHNSPCAVRGDIDHENVTNHYLDTKTARNTSEFALWLTEASGEALLDAGLIDAEGNSLFDITEGGSVIGSCVGGVYDELLPAYDTFNQRGPDRLSPHLHVKFPLNMASYTAQWRFGLAGPSNTVSTACATGTQAIGEAFHAISHGITNLMIAGAAESTSNPMGTSGFAAMRALVTDSNDCPEKALRPFDQTRAGFALGEGAGALILEDYEQACERGAPIYAEILGFASSNDAYHPIAPHPLGYGAGRAIENALADAGVTADEVGHVQAHAASTPAGDLAEGKAISLVFGDRTSDIPVTSIKGNIGHCMGAAGAIESVMAIYSMASQLIPPTRNYEHPDPEIPLDVVAGAPRNHSFDVMTKHGFGLGGQNACLIIGRAPAEFQKSAPITS